MSNNFEKVQQTLMQDYNTKLQSMQETLSKQLTEQLKLDYLDQNLKKLNENFQNVSKVALDNNLNKQSQLNSPQILEMEKRILELSLQIKQEQEEKKEIKNELITFKNKVDQMSKKDPNTKDLTDKMNKVLLKYDDVIRKMEEITLKGAEQHNVASQYKELLSNIMKENHEMKMKIEDGTLDQNLLREDLNKIEESYQNTILKIHERMQNIEQPIKQG